MTKVLVLDFDNCIVLDEKIGTGSEEVKDEAWFTVFPEYSRVELEPVLEQAKKDIAGGKGDRKDIVERVSKHFNVAEEKIPQEIINRCERFNQVLQEGIQKIGVSKKIQDTLAQLSKKLPIYVNTATPRQGALESLDAIGITSLFKKIYGRPGTKVENLQSAIKDENVKPEKLLFVDDQESGWIAAQVVGCGFIGIHTARNRKWKEKDQPFPIIRSLTELLTMV
jgi:phosphoglycolate phosphatase-like HAD superfamily hydrolase